jgi:hypothetical protein
MEDFSLEPDRFRASRSRAQIPRDDTARLGCVHLFPGLLDRCDLCLDPRRTRTVTIQGRSVRPTPLNVGNREKDTLSVPLQPVIDFVISKMF